jgi:hypothetical protein
MTIAVVFDCAALPIHSFPLFPFVLSHPFLLFSLSKSMKRRTWRQKKIEKLLLEKGKVKNTALHSCV